MAQKKVRKVENRDYKVVEDSIIERSQQAIDSFRVAQHDVAMVLLELTTTRHEAMNRSHRMGREILEIECSGRCGSKTSDRLARLREGRNVEDIIASMATRHIDAINAAVRGTRY